MKHISYSILGLVFAFGILLASLFRHPGMSSLRSTDQFSAGVSYSTQSAILAVQRLPYPGVLPDSPLYFPKMIRDRLRLIFTFSDNQKIALVHSYGDKRIGAAYFLAHGNNIALAYTTATKALQYMDQAVLMAETEPFEEEERRSILLKLDNSIGLHLKAIEEMILLVEGDSRVQFERVRDSYSALSLRVKGKLN